MIGKRLGHFQILEKIGEGGMGVVYRAEDQRLGRQVAIKVLPRDAVRNEERRARFLREARTTAAVTHPNIAAVYDVDEQDGAVFLAMELVRGRTLRQVLDEGPLSREDVLRYSIEIAEALEQAHQAGVVHRDLKPENLIVGPDRHIKILDFGLAKLREGETGEGGDSSEHKTVSAGMTMEGRVLGTAAYMSPEQARGLAVDYRSDLFSLGVVIYEMVTATNPFRGETTTDTLSSVLRDEPPPLVERVPDLPQELDRIVKKCVEKDPAQRYQQSDEIVVDLRRLRRQSDSDSMPDVSGTHSGAPRPRGWTRPAMWSVLGVALVALIAVGAPRLFRSGDPAAVQVESGVGSLAVLPLRNLKDANDPERYGRILQELIITDLSGSDELKVVSSQRLFDVQKRIVDSADGLLERDLATTVARQAGASTLLTGTLSQLGERWILTSQLIDVNDGTVLQSERIDGPDLYAMVDQISTIVREDMGLGTLTARGPESSVDGKASPSIEAYQYFLAGVDWLNETDFEKAIKAFRRAIDVDPSFGKAHYHLAIAMWWGAEGYMLSDGLEDPEEVLVPLANGDLRATPMQRRLAEALLPLVGRRWERARPLFEALVRDYPDEKEAWYGLGEARFHSLGGESSLASVEAFENALELDPTFHLAYAHVEDVHRSGGAFEDGERLSRALIELNPNDPFWYREWVKWLILAGDGARVEPAISESLRQVTDPADLQEFYRTVAWAFHEQGREDRAELLFNEALALDLEAPSDDLVLTAAAFHLEQLRFDESERLIGGLLEREPGHLMALRRRGELLHRERRYREALDQVRAYAEQGVDWAPVYAYWAGTAASLGRHEEAARALSEGLKRCVTPRNRMQLWVDLAWEYGNLGEPVRQVELSRRALSEVADTWEPHNALGWGLLRLRRYEEAGKALTDGLEIDPHNSSLLNAMSRLKYEVGDSGSSLKYARKRLEQEKFGYGAQWQIVAATLWAGRYDEADRLLDEVTSSLPTVRDQRKLLVSVSDQMTQVGRHDRAAELAQRALEMGPHASTALPARRRLAGVAMRKGDLAAADAHLAEALALRPDDDATLASQVMLLLLRGEPIRAEEAAREMLRSGPVSALTRRLLVYALIEQDRSAEAESVARELLAAAPSRLHHALLAWVLIAAGSDLDEGRELAEKAVALPWLPRDERRKWPFVPSAEHALGLAYLEGGRFEEAIAQLTEASRLRPERESIQGHLEDARKRAKM